MYRRIKEFRSKAGLKQTELADELGCSIATLQNWESGKNLPSVEAGIKMCELFGCTLDELYLGKGGCNNPTHRWHNIPEREVVLIMQTFNYLKEKDPEGYNDMMTRVGRFRVDMELAT